MISMQVSNSSLPEGASTNRGVHKVVKRPIFGHKKCSDNRFDLHNWIKVPLSTKYSEKLNVCWKLPVSFLLSS